MNGLIDRLTIISAVGHHTRGVVFNLIKNDWHLAGTFRFIVRANWQRSHLRRHRQPDEFCARIDVRGRASRTGIRPARRFSNRYYRSEGVTARLWTALELAAGTLAASAAQGGVIGNEEVKAEEPQHAANEAFCLPQGQVEDQPQCKHKLDSQIRVARLTARRGPPWGIPSGYGGLIEPEGQLASPLEPGFVFRPVLDPGLRPKARMA